MEKTERRKQFLLNLAYVIVILAILYFVLKYLINIIMPFFVAVIFAAISRPLAKLLSAKTKTKKNPDGSIVTVPRKVHIKNNVAAILSVVILFILIVGLLTLICVKIINRTSDVIDMLPQVYTDTMEPALNSTLEYVENLAGHVDEETLATIKNAAMNIIGTIGSKVTELSGKTIVWVSTIASRIPSLFLNTIICLIATVFMAVDFDNISLFLRSNLPGKSLRFATEFKDSLVDMVWQFLKSYFLIFIITTSEITIGFLLIGQSRPLLLGILIAVFDAFPIVGSGMILLPFSIITLLSGKLQKGIALFVIYLVVVIARQIIEPKIVGKHVGMKPLVTLICMYIGTKLFGGIGLFALPILAAILTDMNTNGIIHIFNSIPQNNQSQESTPTDTTEAGGTAEAQPESD